MSSSTRSIILTFVVLSASCGSDPPTSGPGSGTGPAGNRAPNIDPVGPQELNEGELLQLQFSISDPDGDTLFLEVANEPEGALFDPVHGTFSYQPEHDVVTGAETSLTLPDMTVTVDDNYLSDHITISITVYDMNRAPFFLTSEAGSLSELTVQLDPDTEERVEFQVIDPDGDEVSLRLSDSPAYARLDGDALIVAPTSADTGADEFSIVADDLQDTAALPVTVLVGDIAAELPGPLGLKQSTLVDGDVAVGGSVYDGRVTFSASHHLFEHGELRLQVELAEVGTNYEDGTKGTSEAVAAGVQPLVDIELTGGKSYRWRARFLSDEFGAGPYASFGGNADSEADLIVTIVPETSLDVVPHNPSPREVTFEFSSPNVTDFECQLDDADWEECGPDSETYNFLSPGPHTFRVRGVTEDGTPDPTPEEFTWEVLELDPPDTAFTASPEGASTCSAEPNCGSITFFFTSNQHPSVTYECKLSMTDEFEGDWSPCAQTDAWKEYVGLRNGNYTFYARAINLVAQKDDSPLSANFNSNCGDSCE